MRRAVWWVAGLVTIVEVVFANGYGYHRDELYFLASGQRCGRPCDTSARVP